ncbi:MAG: hypothetical protein ABSC06_11810 [Rhodopila sp.]|jgi:hypothetical protein
MDRTLGDLQQDDGNWLIKGKRGGRRGSKVVIVRDVAGGGGLAEGATDGVAWTQLCIIVTVGLCGFY